MGKVFFVAHAVRARGSDGHQNVCGRSTILKLWENRWKCKRLEVLYKKQKTSKQHEQTTNKTPPRNKKTSSKLSETWNYAFTTIRTLGALRTSSRRHRNIPQVDWYPKLPIVVGFPCIHPSRWQGELDWFTHVFVDEAVQGRTSGQSSQPKILNP